MNLLFSILIWKIEEHKIFKIRDDFKKVSHQARRKDFGGVANYLKLC